MENLNKKNIINNNISDDYCDVLDILKILANCDEEEKKIYLTSLFDCGDKDIKFRFIKGCSEAIEENKKLDAVLYEHNEGSIIFNNLVREVLRISASIPPIFEHSEIAHNMNKVKTEVCKNPDVKNLQSYVNLKNVKDEQSSNKKYDGKISDMGKIRRQDKMRENYIGYPFQRQI